MGNWSQGRPRLKLDVAECQLAEFEALKHIHKIYFQFLVAVVVVDGIAGVMPHKLAERGVLEVPSPLVLQLEKHPLCGDHAHRFAVELLDLPPHCSHICWCDLVVVFLLESSQFPEVHLAVLVKQRYCVGEQLTEQLWVVLLRPPSQGCRCISARSVCGVAVCPVGIDILRVVVCPLPGPLVKYCLHLLCIENSPQCKAHVSPSLVVGDALPAEEGEGSERLGAQVRGHGVAFV